MVDFLKLTELANKIIGTGNMDVYQETYEMINLKVQAAGIKRTCHISLVIILESSITLLMLAVCLYVVDSNLSNWSLSIFI